MPDAARQEKMVLVGGLGTGSTLGRYRGGARETTAWFQAEALLRLGMMDSTPDEVVVVTTGEARASRGEAFERALSSAGAGAVHWIEVPADQDSPGLEELFRRVRDGLLSRCEGCRVHLDLGSGLRHVSFILYWSALVLEAEGKIAIDGAWYVPPPRNGGNPVEPEDLGRLLFLVDWQAGWKAFRRFGTLRPFGAILEEHRKYARELQVLASPVRDLATALEQARPLDVGKYARELLAKARSLAEQGRRELGARSFAPGATRVLDAVGEFVGRYAFPPGAPGLSRVKGDRQENQQRKEGEEQEEKGKPREIPRLDMVELRREIELCRWYLEHGRPRNALLVLREWMINVVIYAASRGEVPRWFRWQGPGKPVDDWLQRNRARVPAERRLRRLKHRTDEMRGKAGLDDLAHEIVARHWRKVTEWRNDLAHAAFNDHWIERTEVLCDKVRDRVQRLEELLPRADDPPGGNPWRLEYAQEQGKVVIQPVGRNPGVLATAVGRLEPDLLVVLCSGQSRPLAEDILDRLAFPGDRVRWFQVTDHLRCHRVDKDSAWFQTGEILSSCEELAVVLTGGSSAMIALAGHLGKEAEKIGTPVSRYILVDPRTREEQLAAPLVVGDAVPLDGDPSGDGEED